MRIKASSSANDCSEADWQRRNKGGDLYHKNLESNCITSSSYLLSSAVHCKSGIRRAVHQSRQLLTITPSVQSSFQRHPIDQYHRSYSRARCHLGLLGSSTHLHSRELGLPEPPPLTTQACRPGPVPATGSEQRTRCCKLLSNTVHYISRNDTFITNGISASQAGMWGEEAPTLSHRHRRWALRHEWRIAPQREHQYRHLDGIRDDFLSPR